MNSKTYRVIPNLFRDLCKELLLKQSYLQWTKAMCTFLLIIEELRFISELPTTFIQECGNINWEKALSSSSVTLGRMFCKKCTSEALALVGVLVYTEEYDNISDAIAREKQLKNWHKQWK